MNANPAPEGVPNPTIYIQNLNEKIKLKELKDSLYHVFSQFGQILDIYVSKDLKRRGQAWVVFEDLSGSTKAVREMPNFVFYGKPMRVQFAMNKSDIIAKIDGSFKPREKRKAAEAIKGPAKKKQATGERPAVAKLVATAPPMPVQVVPEEPNYILFLENLPENMTADMLKLLFEQYAGFREARMVPNRPGIAFVEYCDQYQAALAREGLQGYAITTDKAMKVTFARK